MNTLKTVFIKLFKEETKLASHEIELGTLKELETDIVEMQFGIKKIKELKKEIKSMYENTMKKVDTDLSGYSVKAKEVGVDPEKTDAFKKLQELKKELESLK
jgi:succinate dehydrogenase flavin-adding protein (antitoxin of CptAB toxin-antitoxin module)